MHQIKYKSILCGEYQSLEETIFESLFCIGFIAFFIIVIVGSVYGGVVLGDMNCGNNIRKNDLDCNTEIIKMARMILFWSYVSVISSIFISVISVILFLISKRFIHNQQLNKKDDNNKRVLSSVVVYGVPLGYFLAYNFVLLLCSNM